MDAVDVTVVELAFCRPVSRLHPSDQFRVGHGLQPVDANDRIVPVTVSCACMCTPKDSGTPERVAWPAKVPARGARRVDPAAIRTQDRRACSGSRCETGIGAAAP
jgi:hypothetical protein